MEVEDAPQARSSTHVPATGTSSQATSFSDHGSREKSRDRTRSRGGIRRGDTKIQGLVSSLPDMLSRMIDSRLPDWSRQPSPASSLHSDLHVTREEAEHTQELGFIEILPPLEGETSGQKRDLSSPTRPAVTLIPSPILGSPPHPPPAALAQANP
ncbi:hypothetical protein Pcinc_003063 [Petrolisthes cinctipes]|uniref:Uncharacterized protein n=1 Tax=Petrolisthes cinctipes TaxID=88211 RepID=A0AAE1GHX8_PETCI|nr:hypothetical protein Pcinc_003063 [Petrolisthes cinctipes]